MKWFKKLWSVILPKKRMPIRVERDYAEIYSDKYLNDLLDTEARTKA